MLALNKEWQFRYEHERNHKSVDQLLRSDILYLAQYSFIDEPFTNPALAMPDEYKSKDPIESYRDLYRYGKTDLLKYTKRKRPDWLK